MIESRLHKTLTVKDDAIQTLKSQLNETRMKNDALERLMEKQRKVHFTHFSQTQINNQGILVKVICIICTENKNNFS